MNAISMSITPKAIRDLLDELETSKQSQLRAWAQHDLGAVRRRALYRNKIVSNMVPSAVHANPSVTQKARIANWCVFRW
jgi:hypothetical protein